MRIQNGLRNPCCCCSNLSNDDIISYRPGLKTGAKLTFFDLKWGPNFTGEPGGKPPPRIPRGTNPHQGDDSNHAVIWFEIKNIWKTVGRE